MSASNPNPAPPAWNAKLRLYGLMLRILAGLALARVLRRLAPAIFMPRPNWQPPPGPHAVGVRDADMGSTRRIMVRIWYPAAPNTLPRRRFHAPDEAAWLLQNAPNSVKDLAELSGLETASAQNAPALQASQRFPVLLFSHGLGGTVAQNTQLCERLASTGYVVVSITHPEGGSSIRYADGSESLVTPEMNKRRFNLTELGHIVNATRLAPTAEAAAASARRLLTVQGLQPELRLWADDTSAVLNHLQAGQLTPPIPDVLALMDLGRVGAFGMSFGGAASALAAHEDERIAAAINLDGNQFGHELWDTTIRTPLLELRSDDALIASGGSFNNFHYERFTEAGRSGKVWRYHVQHSTHGGFTDMVLLGTPLLRRLMWLGRIPGPRMQDLMFDLTRRFFDQHLKADPAAWPANPAAQWPELQAIDTRRLRSLDI